MFSSRTLQKNHKLALGDNNISSCIVSSHLVSVMKVKKSTRSKVPTACVNCRKRKIKCTGKYPCTNCISYDCTCVFLKKNLTQEKDTSLPLATTTVPRSSSHHNEKVSADAHHLDSVIKLDNQDYFKLVNEPIQTPVSPNTTNASDATNNNNILFEDDSDYQKQLITYQKILTNLYSLPPCADTQVLINSTKSQLNNLISNWKPGIDYHKLAFQPLSPSTKVHRNVPFN